MRKIFIVLLFVIAGKLQAQQANRLSAADKVYGLSKLWQEVNYNFIYLDKVSTTAWDSLYRQMITTVQETKTDYAYYRQLQKFYAFLKDGHTSIYFPRGIEEMNTMFGNYRFFLKNIDGKAIVVRTNLSKKEEIPAGSEVVEVNGKTTTQYIEDNVAPYIASSTSYVLQDRSIDRLLAGLEGDSFLIKIKRPDQKLVSLSLVHKKTAEEAVYPPFEKNAGLLDLKWYAPQVAYLALNSFDDPKIDTLFEQQLPELYKAKALIVDLRHNGGGNTNTGIAILKYLTNDTLLYGSKSTSRLHIPTYKAWGKFTSPSDTLHNEWASKTLLSFLDRYYYNFDFAPDTISLKAKRLVVPTVLLLGHETASAAEDFLIYADRQAHMIRMGENSFGSTGQPYMFDLPGGGSARVCTKKDTYPDGREFVGYGIKPDITVTPTLSDYLQQKDPVLEKAIDYLKKKIQ